MNRGKSRLLTRSLCTYSGGSEEWGPFSRRFSLIRHQAARTVTLLSESLCTTCQCFLSLPPP